VKIKAIFLALSIGARVGVSQGFINLDFESATIMTIHNPGGDTYTAMVPGWSVNTPNYVNGDPNSIPYNDIALDSAAVNLEGTNSPYEPAIQGMYSIFLQGGTMFAPTTNGASIWQTAQIPATARSIIYWGNALQVSFAGQMLSFGAIGSGSNYTIYGADISAFAGQTGELLFREPWESSGFLDNIQFSSSSIPEPSALGLVALGSLLFGFRRREGSRP